MLFEKVKERKEREKGKACKPDSFVCPPNDLKSICFFTNCILLRPPTRWGPPCIAHAPSPPPPCPGHASLRLLLQGYACTRARALGRIIVSYLGCFFFIVLFTAGTDVWRGVVLLTPLSAECPSVSLVFTQMPTPETMDNTV